MRFRRTQAPAVNVAAAAPVTGGRSWSPEARRVAQVETDLLTDLMLVLGLDEFVVEREVQLLGDAWFQFHGAYQQKESVENAFNYSRLQVCAGLTR